MFLLARETRNDSPTGLRSHFGYDHEGWSGWPRWADADSSWAEVKELFAKVAVAGEPAGGCVESAGGVFTREFKRLTVRVDCANRIPEHPNDFVDSGLPSNTYGTLRARALVRSGRSPWRRPPGSRKRRRCTRTLCWAAGRCRRAVGRAPRAWCSNYTWA